MSVFIYFGFWQIILASNQNAARQKKTECRRHWRMVICVFDNRKGCGCPGSVTIHLKNSFYFGTLRETVTKIQVFPLVFFKKDEKATVRPVNVSSL